MRVLATEILCERVSQFVRHLREPRAHEALRRAELEGEGGESWLVCDGADSVVRVRLRPSPLVVPLDRVDDLVQLQQHSFWDIFRVVPRARRRPRGLLRAAGDERVLQQLRGVRPVLWLAAHAFPYEIPSVLREAVFRQLGRRVLAQSLQQAPKAVRRLRRVRELAQGARHEGDAHGPDIRLCVVRLAQQPLRGHVRHRPDEGQCVLLASWRLLG
mmetsp:Transcript_1682/g.5961  ORF Transcript_1682/g.5961 Transcript_1682/m.5961 type:complete len:215 (+) Transcript_1682:201-845(+)